MTFFAGTAVAHLEGWYGAHLAALGERILCQDGETRPTIFRLTWLPTFDPSVVVRVEEDSDGYRLEAKIGSGAGGYGPGHVVRQTALTLSPAEGEAFEGLLEESDFWYLPTLPPPDRSGLDGAQWVLEGLAGGRYHVVDRWSPDAKGPDAPFRRLGEWLLAKSGLAPAELVSGY